MKSIGNLLESAANTIGEAAEKALVGTGEVMAKLAENKHRTSLAKKSRMGGRVAGKTVKVTARLSGLAAGFVIDKTMEAGKKAASQLAHRAVKSEVKIYGDSEKFYEDKIVEGEYTVVEEKIIRHSKFKQR